MIVAIRIKGMVNVPKSIEATLSRLRLRRKYACVLLKESKEVLGMLKKVKYYISYGTLSNEVMRELIRKRAKKYGNKSLTSAEIDDVLMKLERGTPLKKIGIKPFFRLHPPIKGFKKGTKSLYPKGVLGENKEIDKLLIRML